MNKKQLEQYQDYLKLMRSKRFMIWFVPMVMIIAFLLRVPPFLTFIVMAVSAYISHFVFLAKNTCPWCKEPFFFYTPKGIKGMMIIFVFQKKCINCTKPTVEDILDADATNNGS